MSSDSELERLLREASTTLPEPATSVTGRARESVVAAATRPRRRLRRFRVAALVGVALAVAVVLGLSLGLFIAPSGTAASEPVGLGFLPEPGWSALQTATRGTPDQPAVAMAANVPFAPEDVVRGLAEPSALPYATLLRLPPRGVVVVATFIPTAGQQWTSTRYPARRLPLRVRDATPYIELGTQIRPERPLGQYQLGAVVNGYDVDLQIYAGTQRLPRTLAAALQRQLDRLVVRPGRPLDSGPTATSSPRTSTAGAQSVTMTFVRFYDNACRCYKARVSGQVSSGKAGEYVVVLRTDCGRSSGRSVVAATTRAGGIWEAEIPVVARPDAQVAESYRARWNDALSDRVSFQGRLSSVSGKRLADGRQTVTVVTPTVNPVNLKGRQVLLQRRVAGNWRRVAASRLAPHRTRFYAFTATFSVPRRGWVLRALVPAKAAAPCFTRQTSEPWRS